jgi:N-acetylglucosaminyldiphosphoundecaprenol N-acetyl-beta-D-mannosaminyltransferase
LGIDVFGVQFDNLTLSEAAEAGARLTAEGFHYWSTPNPELVNLARADAGYRAVLNGAALVLPDGIGSCMPRGCSAAAEAAGPRIDFAQRLLEYLERDGRRLFLLAPSPAWLNVRPPICKKSIPPSPSAEPGTGILKIRRGWPKRSARPGPTWFSSAWARPNRSCDGPYGPDTGAHLMAGLGARWMCLPSGEARPRRLAAHGLEWLYRLLHQPSRFGRMVKLPLFFVVGRRRARQRRMKGMPGKLIVFEGTDARGNPPMFSLLCDRMKKDGRPLNGSYFPNIPSHPRRCCACI